MQWYFGIGVAILQVDENIVVSRVFSGGGAESAGDNGYLQTIPMARVTVETQDGSRERLIMPIDTDSFDTISAGQVIMTEGNVVGIIRGSDPAVAREQTQPPAGLVPRVLLCLCVCR